jgi:microsomal dipeptidase-like Zn-dependent dipeptidase
MIKKISAIIVSLVIVAAVLFFWLAPTKIERAQNLTIPHAPYKISAAALELHRSLFVADLHTDSLLWKRDLLQQSDVGHVDLRRLQSGNVALQIFSAVTKSPSGLNTVENTADSDDITLLSIVQLWPAATWSSLYERARYQLEKLKDFSEASDGALQLVLSKRDLRSLIDARANGENTVGAIFLIEGAHPLQGKIENLDRLYEQGMRLVAFTHFFDNELGGSLHGVSKAGLTDFGRQVVQRADELEITIDIAHASPKLVREILALTDRPVILSHGGVKGVCDTPRNLDDELMREVAARGGLLGIGYWVNAICDVSPTGIVHAIRYAIDLVGVEHVALGSDFDGTVTTPFDTSELAILTQTMLNQGFTEEEIRKVMGGNAQRFFLESLPD